MNKNPRVLSDNVSPTISQTTIPSVAASAGPQVGCWPVRKKNIAAESGRFVAIQPQGTPQTSQQVISGLVIGYCTAEAYDRRALYRHLRKRYGKKKGRVVMHPDAICIQIFDDEKSRMKAQEQAAEERCTYTQTHTYTYTHNNNNETLHVPNSLLAIDTSIDERSLESYTTLNHSIQDSESRYGTVGEDMDWLEYPSSVDDSWGIRLAKSNDTGYVQTLPKEIYYFDYGVVVCWGLSDDMQKKLLEELQEYEIGPLASNDIDIDSFEVIVDPSVRPNIRNDIITLESIKRDNVRLAISLAVAQSTKLGVQEDMVLQTVDRYNQVAQVLAATGSFNLDRKETNKVIGELYTLISVNLSPSLLNLPDFLWDRSDDSSQTLYSALRTYLQIGRRLNVVDRRIRTFSTIVDYITTELQATSSLRLYWLLITVLGISAFIEILNIYMRLAWEDADIIG